jgi:hypothetical protein
MLGLVLIYAGMGIWICRDWDWDMLGLGMHYDGIGIEMY